MLSVARVSLPVSHHTMSCESLQSAVALKVAANAAPTTTDLLILNSLFSLFIVFFIPLARRDEATRSVLDSPESVTFSFFLEGEILFDPRQILRAHLPSVRTGFNTSHSWLLVLGSSLHFLAGDQCGLI